MIEEAKVEERHVLATLPIPQAPHQEQLQQQSSGNLGDDDCEIDDPELLTNKKHLMSKVTPIGLINVLQAKHKELGITERLSE